MQEVTKDFVIIVFCILEIRVGGGNQQNYDSSFPSYLHLIPDHIIYELLA